MEAFGKEIPAGTSQLLKKIEQSQFGYNQTLQGPYGPRRMVYTDYTASGRSLRFIEEYIHTQVLPTYANTHTTTTNTSRQTTHYREEARQLMKQTLNCSDDDVLLFVGSGCTGALHKLMSCLCLHHLKQPPVVFVSPFEHHANLLLWRESGADVVWVAEDATGRVDIADLEKKLQHYSKSGRQLIGSLSAASNITGVLTDTLSFSALLHKYGALSFWDYATAAPYIKMDMNPLVVSADRDLVYKDAIVFSMHKFVGGPETPGVLVAKKKLFQNSSSAPSTPAGGTVSFVTPTRQHYWSDIEVREEGGTPHIIGSIRAGLAVHLKAAVGSELVEAIEFACVHKVQKQWEGIEELYVTGPHAVPKLPIFSFIVRHRESGRFLHHNFVSTLLNDVFGIQSRGGCMCAGPYAQILLGIDEPLAQRYIMEGSHYSKKLREALKPGVTRLSFPYFMNEEAIEFVVEAVKLTARDGWKLLPQYNFSPETGTFHNSRHLSVSGSQCQRLTSISYDSNGEMTYPTHNTHSEPPSYKDVLSAAERLFERAVEDSIPQSRELAHDYSNMLLLGPEVEEMRWFLVPYEAHLYLTGCHPPLIQVPFHPRNYENDDWCSKEYLSEWDRHWNPQFWEEMKTQRQEEQSAAAPLKTDHQLWTIYPTNQSPTHKIQLQPLKQEEPHRLQKVRKKKGFVSMESLYLRKDAAVVSTGSLTSPLSSGYSSEGESAGGKAGQRHVKSKLKRRRRKNEAQYTDDSQQGNKCVIM